jgi:HPt (histidine-containing phosphotransfer) domain-containing protein
MVDWFLHESPALMNEMQAAHQAGDRVRLARTAHHLGGTLVYLGADPAEQAVRTLERACEDGGAEVASALAELEREIRRLEPALIPHGKTKTA